MSIKLGTIPIAGLAKNTVVNGFHIFDFKWSDKKINDISWLRSSTFSWQSGSVYTTAYNHLVTDISGITAETETIGSYTVTFYRATDGHKICLADQETTVANIYTETGIAWYYILDTDNAQFKLPRTKWGFNGLRSGVGNMVEQEVLLPDITGNVNTGTTCGQVSGAFAYGGSVSGAGQESQPVYWASFKASRSSSVYSGDGTNTKIQPPATEMYLYFYVGEYSRSAIEQTAGLNTELLNEKVDVSSLSTCHVVIDTYINGTSGYRIWDDGYCEQWGALSDSTITFLKTFANTNYTITTNSTTNSTSGSSATYNDLSFYSNASYSKTTSSIIIRGKGYWKVSGYLADGEY